MYGCIEDSNNISIGIHFFKVLVQIHYSRSPGRPGDLKAHISLKSGYPKLIFHSLPDVFLKFECVPYLSFVIEEMFLQRRNSLQNKVAFILTQAGLISLKSSDFQNALAPRCRLFTNQNL